METNADQTRPGSSGQGCGGSSNACLPCRKVKMKCYLAPNTSKCDRCVRRALDCVFQQHRRGRKLGARLSGHPYSRSTTSQQTQLRRADPKPISHSSVQFVSGEEGHVSNESSEFWNDSDGFQPSSLLNKHTGQGNFSMRNILSTGRAPKEPRYGLENTTYQQDPISAGLVNVAIAESLFEGFMKSLNPFVSQLDPELHTFPFVRERSAFLLSAVLAAAAKALNPSIYPQLLEHAEVQFVDSFRRGLKSPEVVQAILLTTYWKEPEDTRVFVSVGLAIRIAMDLGWHKSTGKVDNVPPREARNIQRTWLVLFVYDRSISLQTGKPWMIEQSQFIEAVVDWHNSSLALPSDALLCGFVELRLLTTEIPGLVHHPDSIDFSTQRSSRAVLAVIRRQVESWRRRWIDDTAKEPRHRFLLRFYSEHTLLLLHSVSLKASLETRSYSFGMEPFWISYNAAIAMLQLATEQTATHFLYFVQDSVHVMIAYAAVFLVKLLFTLPSSVIEEMESTILDTLRTAWSIFSKQAAPANSGCALQASFLGNIVVMVEKFCRGQTAHEVPEHNMTGISRSRPASMSAIAGRGIQNESPTTLGESPAPYHPSRVNEITPDASITPQPQELSFFDEQMWASVFAIAGFSVNDGVFLPDLGDVYST